MSYAYDHNGNLANKTGGWVYSYDYENRLTKVVQSGTTLQTNSYDGDGNRVKQVAGSSTFTYSYHGLGIVYDKNVTGGTTTVTKHFYAGGLQVAKMVGSTVYYLHQDALGSTRLEVTSSVTVVFSSNYVPYGQNYGVTGKEVFQYTGQPYDAATGFYYFSARFYDDSTGRFITQDSYAGSLEDPLSLDRYAYARENPERYTDTNGHTFQVMVDAGGNDPNAQTTSTCVNGVCTVTTTETGNGYSTTITTTFNTETESNGGETTYMKTTTTDANLGVTTSTTSTASTTYANGRYTLSQSSTTTVVNTYQDAVRAYEVLLAGSAIVGVIVTAVLEFGAVPLDAAIAAGDASATAYMSSAGLSATAEGVQHAWEMGASSILQAWG